MSKIKLVAVDLDGTLLDNNKLLSPRTKEALAACAAAGIIVIPATGRPATGFPYVAENMPGFRYALTSNGALVYDFKEHRNIYEDCIPVENVLAVMDAMQPYDVMLDVYVNGWGYSEQRNIDNAEYFFDVPEMAHQAKSLVQYIRTTRKAVTDMRRFVIDTNTPAEKLVMFFHDLSYQERLGKIINDLGFIKLTSAYPNNLELNSATANKGDSLIRFGEVLGIARDEIMAFGDGLNDCDMIRAAGVGVAMANAHPDLKAIADRETLSNVEDGVAVELEKLL